MYDIIVIGAGTAGLTAAIYGQRAGKKVLVLEEMSYGGQIINTPEVENYPGIQKISGFEFANNLYNQAIGLGAEVKFEQVSGVQIGNKAKAIEAEKEFESGKQNIKYVTTTKNTYETRAVIIATGARNRPLGLDKEAEYVGKGISYCATCDGMFFRGKKVAVNGGGNTALEDALFLSNYCEHVYLIHRRDAFRGEDKQVEMLKQRENVTFCLNKTVISLQGENALEQIVIKDKITGEETTLEVSGLFVAIGQIPANDVFSDVVGIDSAGYVIAGEDCRTNQAGIYAAGDCRTKTVRQLTTAAADGAVAALAAASEAE